MIRGIVSLGFAALITAGIPAATADPVVDQKVTAAKGDDGAITASIEVINTGSGPVAFHPSTVPFVRNCLLTADPASATSGQSTKVTVAIPDGCFADTTTIGVDLDGVGAGRTLPPTVVTAPNDEASDWTPLWLGLLVSTLLALVVGLRGVTVRQDTLAAAHEPDEIASREATYLEVRGIVDERMWTLPVAPIEWVVPLPRATYGPRDAIGNLEAGWSFQDSWVANLTVASTALFALLSSSDVLTAVLGEEPAAALGVMTVAGLVSAALIGVANTVVKVFGDKASDVTVAGLNLSTAIVVLAAGLQVATIGIAAARAAGSWPLAIGALALSGIVAAVLEVYAIRSLGQTVREGISTSVPQVPDDAVSTWAATDGWQKQVVGASLRATYSEWIHVDGTTAEPGTRTSGEQEVGKPARKPALEPVARSRSVRRRSLL